MTQHTETVSISSVRRTATVCSPGDLEPDGVASGAHHRICSGFGRGVRVMRAIDGHEFVEGVTGTGSSAMCSVSRARSRAMALAMR